MTDEIKEAITKAKAAHLSKTDSLDLHLNKQERFGSKALKQKNFGADAFMQLAIQVCFSLCHSLDKRHSSRRTNCICMLYRHYNANRFQPTCISTCTWVHVLVHVS